MSTASLRVTLVQPETIWHDPAANRAGISASLAGAPPSDVIVLPEMFTTGFSNDAASNAELMHGETVEWMRALAKARDAAVTGSVAMRDGDAVFNRLLFVAPSGVLWHYDKRHLFRMAHEPDWYAAGRERLIVEFREWRICLLVCYDLRFPVFARNRVDPSRGGDLEYDLLVYVANWPAARHEAWRTLLRARAMENLCYVVGVNRCGTDGNGHPYLGGSIATDPLGVAVADCGATPQVAQAELSLERLREHRRRFPAHLDADRFLLEN